MLAFAKFLSQFHELAFFHEMSALSDKKSTFVLDFGFFRCCIFTILLKYDLKCRFLTKRAP